MSTSPIELNAETQQFFEELMDGCADISRKYIRMARMNALDVTEKGGARLDGNPVTLADKEIEELIKQKIFARYPGIEFLGEEGGIQSSATAGAHPQLRFVVDPLDGTAPFTRGQTHWVVCNFALQQRDSEQGEWQTVLSGAYAPEKDLATLADHGGTRLRSQILLGDRHFHPVDELRASMPQSPSTMLEAKELVGTHIDLRLAGKDDKHAEMLKDLRKMGCTVRNVGGFAATSLEFLPVKKEKFAFVSGNPGGEWDWRAPEHFLKQAGYTTGIVNYAGAGDKGADYPVFIAAGTPQLFEFLKGMVERKLTQNLTLVKSAPESAFKRGQS